jgi:hypothetical protein
VVFTVGGGELPEQRAAADDHANAALVVGV